MTSRGLRIGCKGQQLKSWSGPISSRGLGRMTTGVRLRDSSLQRHSDTYGPGDAAEDIDEVNSYEVTDVTPGETYYPQIRGVNAVGSGLWSRAAIAVPGGRPPGKITGITALGTDIVLILHFPAPDEGDTLIGYYQYQIGDGNPWVDFISHDQTKVQQRGTIEVPENGVYSVRLRAVNLTGAGPPSDAIVAEAAIPSRLSRPDECSVGAHNHRATRDLGCSSKHGGQCRLQL